MWSFQEEKIEIKFDENIAFFDTVSTYVLLIGIVLVLSQ